MLLRSRIVPVEKLVILLLLSRNCYTRRCIRYENPIVESIKIELYKVILLPSIKPLSEGIHCGERRKRNELQVIPAKYSIRLRSLAFVCD